MDQENCDLIIVGGGPAGLTAAIYAARANLKTILIEQLTVGGQVNSTWSVENFPSYSSINGMELMEKVQEQVSALGVRTEEALEIEALHLGDDIKRVATADGEFSAPAVILATGRNPVSLPVLEDCEQVHYCSVCDGSAYKGKRLAVIGGGNSGFDETEYLLGLGVSQVTIVEMLESCPADKTTVDRVFSHPAVDLMVQTTVREPVLEEGRLTGLKLENLVDGTTPILAVDGVFVFIGQHPNTDLFADQVTLTDTGYVVTDRLMHTNLPGVFAAGDVIDKRDRQIITAMSDGAVAALSAEKYIRTTR